MAVSSENITTIAELVHVVNQLAGDLTAEGSATTPLIETGNIDKMNDVLALALDALTVQLS